jgi:hypothetical protein
LNRSSYLQRTMRRGLSLKRVVIGLASGILDSVAKDQLPDNCGLADEWNQRRNSSMISRARACAGAVSVRTLLKVARRFPPPWTVPL